MKRGDKEDFKEDPTTPLLDSSSVDESSCAMLHEGGGKGGQRDLVSDLLTCPIHKNELTHYCFHCCEPLCSLCLQTCKSHYVMTYPEIEAVYPSLSLSYPPLADVAMEVRALEREKEEEEEEKGMNKNNNSGDGEKKRKRHALLLTALELEERTRMQKKEDHIPEGISRHCAIDITLFHFFHDPLRLCSSVDSYRAFPFVSSLPFVIEAEARERSIELGDEDRRVRMSKPFALRVPCDCPGMVNTALTATGHFVSLDDRTGLLRISDLVGGRSVAVDVGRTGCALAPYYASLALVVRARGEVWRAPVLALVGRPRRSSLRCAPGPVSVDSAYFCDAAASSRTATVRLLAADGLVLLDLVSLATRPLAPSPALYIASSTDIRLPGDALAGSRSRRQAVVVGAGGECTDTFPLDSYGVVFIPSSRPGARPEDGVMIDLIGQMTARTWKQKLKKPFYFKANFSLCRVCGDVFIAYDYKSRRFVVLRVSVL